MICETIIVVIDENVLIVANGRHDLKSMHCQKSCIAALKEINKSHIVAIDDVGIILNQYKKYNSHSGKPGTGDRFFRHIFQNIGNPQKVKRVPICKIDDETRGYAELPENTLDKDDPKFLAVAVVAQASVVNATDSDWAEQRALTDALNVPVVQLCPE